MGIQDLDTARGGTAPLIWFYVDGGTSWFSRFVFAEAPAYSILNDQRRMTSVYLMVAFLVAPERFPDEMYAYVRHILDDVVSSLHFFDQKRLYIFVYI